MNKNQLMGILTCCAIALASCDKHSSPEGRMTIKTEAINKRLDDLEGNVKKLSDSISVINGRINKIKNQ